MTAETVIENSMRRGARLVRVLALAEGALALALFAGGFLFGEIALDHLVALSAGARAILLAAFFTVGAAIVGWLVVGPLVHSVSSLYVAQRVEWAFPHFKNSLVTFVQMRRRGHDREILRLVAHQAAACFQGVDIDAGLDSTRFVRLGYGFVALVIAVFIYSVVAPKSMWTSFVRAMHPWADIAAPTRTYIRDVEPGTTRVLLGADVSISADVRNAGPGDAFIKWSRDGALWQAVPMQAAGDRWKGALAHVETNVLYYVSAGDAQSAKYSVTALVPPLVESIRAQLTPPAYTGVAAAVAEGGNIVAPEGTVAAITVKGNKELSSVQLRLPEEAVTRLDVSGDEASGKFTIERSGRYAVALADADGLSPGRPVEYEIVAVPDRPPQVGISGPSEDEEVALDAAVPFALDAADDYGLTKLVFHFESDPANANVKNYIVAPGRKDVACTWELVPELLGARPGDTVSYYLEASDNRDGKANSARTPTYAFKVAKERRSVSAATEPPTARNPKETTSKTPGTPEAAAGVPSEKQKGRTDTTAAAEPGKGKTTESAKAQIDKMIENDRQALETIAKHIENEPKPSAEELAKGTAEQVSGGAREASSKGAASPGGKTGGGETTAKAGSKSQGEAKASEGQAGGQASEETASAKAAASRQEASAESKTKESAQAQGGQGETSSQAQPAAGATQEKEAASEAGNETKAAQSSVETPGEPKTGKERQSQASESSEASRTGQPLASKSEGTASAAEASGSGAPSEAQRQTSAQSQAAEPSGSKDSGSTSSGTGSKPGEGQSQAGQESAPKQEASSKPSGAAQAGTGAPSQGTANAEGQPKSDRQPAEAQSGAKGQKGATASTKPGALGGYSPGERPLMPEAPGPGEAGSLERALGSGGGDERIRAAREIVNRLSADISAGRVDESMLVALGWKPSELRTFVRKYEDAFKEFDPAAFDGQITVEGSLEGGEIRQGQRTAESVGAISGEGGEAKGSENTPDGIPREEVAPQYRRLVDEYYRSLAETRKQGE